MPTIRPLRHVLVAALFFLWLAGDLSGSPRLAAAMADAATRFIDGLSADQRTEAVLPFESDDRTRWHFVPTEQHERKGLPLGAMSEPQRALAHALLEVGLSQRGYLTATAIMDLETVLHALEEGRRRFARDPDLYFFTLFGTPPAKAGAGETWGWRVEGHHVSLHFTIVDGAVIASTPTFFGSNPAEVREGPKAGLRVLADEEDSARALLASLDARQRAVAVIDDVAPNEIVTRNAMEVDPLSPVGLVAADMTPAQRDLLMRVIEAYASHMADEIRTERIAKLREAGVEAIAFAWAGGLEPGDKHYYRIQGPTFLIEYDNAQNDANHIHSVWRDFDGDFGRDLLHEHITAGTHRH